MVPPLTSRPPCFVSVSYDDGFPFGEVRQRILGNAQRCAEHRDGQKREEFRMREEELECCQIVRAAFD